MVCTSPERHWVLLAVTLLLLCTPTLVQAGGFEKLKWGMNRVEVNQAYSGQTLETDWSKSRPAGTEGQVTRILEDTVLFGIPARMEAHFHLDQLAVIRITLLKQNKSDIDKIIGIYSSSDGTPLRNIHSSGGRKTTTWSWPWEGLELQNRR